MLFKGTQWGQIFFKIAFVIPFKVLFIFRCSKNWQKKSAGNHLQQMIACILFLTIFTAAKDEKYFITRICF